MAKISKEHQDALGKADRLIEEARELIQDVRDQNQADYDDMSEKRQESSAGEALLEIINALTDLDDALDTAQSDLSSAVTP